MLIDEIEESLPFLIGLALVFGKFQVEALVWRWFRCANGFCYLYELKRGIFQKNFGRRCKSLIHRVMRPSRNQC